MMPQPRLLLCTDMDRTVIPNGNHTEHPDARREFARFCRCPGVELVYVTGRHKALLLQALEEFALPVPDYAITDVGTRIYRVNAEGWKELDDWQTTIAEGWRGHDHAQLQQWLGDLAQLTLQEESKQNSYKLSYYLPLAVDYQLLLECIDSRLQRHGVEASLVWSIDVASQVGLLDVLPRGAGKLDAIQYLQRLLGYRRDEVIFAGDSGNDLPVLGSAVPAVLVANASEEVRQQALRAAEESGHRDALYLAKAAAGVLGGHYAAGVLQGVWHFAPDFREHLQSLGLDG